MRHIAIYIEGGGDSRQTRSKLRQGFGEFLKELVEIARRESIGWKLVACGGRNSAYDDFCRALITDPDVFNVLLVDSEEAIVAHSRQKGRQQSTNTRLWSHLKQRDNWERPASVDDDQCFLMEQSMETWLIADKTKLAEYYDQGFNAGAIPKTANIESIPKDKLMKSLEEATAHTKTRGKYHKTQHGFDILAKADPLVVRKAASHCMRLFVKLSAQMGAEITDE